MSKTIIERDFWNDEQIIDEYSPEDKLFMMYLLTCPRGNSIGIFKIPVKLMAFEIGYSPEAIRTLLDRFITKYKKISYDYKLQEIAIHHALKYTINSGGKPIEEMVDRALAEVNSLDLIKNVYESMKDWWKLSKRDIDKKIMKVFESEIKKRESILNTNTNTNTNTYTVTDTVTDTEEDSNSNIPFKNDNNDTISDTDADAVSDTRRTQVVSAWNSLDKNVPKIKSLNPGTDRYKLTKARINEYGLESVLGAIRSIDDSQFLKGYRTDFVINFDWFIRPNNFVKVRDGNYADRDVRSDYDKSRDAFLEDSTW